MRQISLQFNKPVCINPVKKLRSALVQGLALEMEQCTNQGQIIYHKISSALSTLNLSCKNVPYDATCIHEKKPNFVKVNHTQVELDASVSILVHVYININIMILFCTTVRPSQKGICKIG